MYLPVHPYHYVSRTLVRFGTQRHYQSMRAVYSVSVYVWEKEMVKGTYSNSQRNSRAAERDGSSTAMLKPAIKIGHVILSVSSGYGRR
jgi:hypothetical protein